MTKLVDMRLTTLELTVMGEIARSGGACQVDNIIQLEQLTDLAACADQAHRVRANLGGDCYNRIADDPVQQLIAVPRLAAALLNKSGTFVTLQSLQHAKFSGR